MPERERERENDRSESVFIQSYRKVGTDRQSQTNRVENREELDTGKQTIVLSVQFMRQMGLSERSKITIKNFLADNLVCQPSGLDSILAKYRNRKEIAIIERAICYSFV